MTPAAPLTARALLRDATRPLHDRVERAVDLTARARTRDGYRALLTAFYGLHAPIERQLAALPWDEAGLDVGARRKGPLLRADLRALGVDPAAVPRCPDLPRTDTVAAGFGCLYVLEGSTLGGQVIARDVEASLGLDAGSGAAFFRSYGADVGRMWRAFTRALDAHVDTEARRREALAAATATFETFERWVGRPAPLPLNR